MVTPRLITRSIAAASCLALLALGTNAPSLSVAAPVPTTDAASTEVVAFSSTTKIAVFEKELLKQINKARSTSQKCGSTTYSAAKPLKWNSKLGTAAEKHSTEMSKKDYLSHNSANGASPFTRIKKAGYKYSAAGETIAAGYATPTSVVKAWLKSPGHCKVLMSKKFTQLGLGYFKGDGKYVNYTTADFGKPKK